jgi:hypothetical protein
MNKHAVWEEDGKLNQWKMPECHWFFRLCLIRHVRAIFKLCLVQYWYALGGGSFYGLRTGYDSWVLYGIWHGLK